MISAKIEGLNDLVKRMKTLEPKLAKSALRSAVGAGAQVINKEAQSIVTVDEGDTKKAIHKKRSRRESNNHRETFTVGVKNNKAPGWWHLEFGTKNMAAKPFLRPAFESKKMEAVLAIKTKLFQKLEQLTSGI